MAGAFGFGSQLGGLAGAIGGGVVGGATVRLLLDDSQFTANLNRAKAETGNAASTMGKFGAAAKTAFLIGGLAAAKFGVDSVKAFLDAQQVAAQTTAVLKSTGGAANVTADDVTTLATSISNLSGIDDDAVQATENLLLTFRNVRNEAGANNDIFNQTTTAITDMATAMNQGAIPSQEQLKQVTIQVGKAMNDPIKGMTALRRVGVTFSDSQVNVITHLQETGHLMEAQKVVLGELTKEFGGAAKAAGDTAAGQFAKFKNEVGNLQEQLGAALLPILQQITGVLQKFAPVIGVVADNLGLLVGAFLGFKAFSFLPALLLRVGIALEGLGAKAAASSLGNLAGSLQSLAGPFAIATAAAVAFEIGLSELNKELGAKLEAAVSQGGAALQEYADKLHSAQNLQHSFLGDLASLAPGFSAIRGAVDDASSATDKAAAAQAHAAQETANHTRANMEVTRSLDLVAGRSVIAADSIAGVAAAHLYAAKAARAEYAAELSLSGGLLGVYGDSLSAAQATRDLAAARAKVNKLADQGKQGTAAYREALLAERQAALGATQAHLQLTNDTRAFIVEQRKAGVATADVIGRLNAQARAAGLSRGEIATLDNTALHYIHTLGGIPSSVKTQFTSNIADQVRQAEILSGRLAALPRQVNIQVVTSYHTIGQPAQPGKQLP